MNFASALFSLKRGRKIKRHHWTGYWCLGTKDSKKPYVVSSSSKKRNTPLYEGTHVWFQTDVSKPFNYIVVKVAEHITDTKYALKEVAASEN